MADTLKKEPKIRDYYSPDDDEKEKIRFVYDRRDAMENSADRQQALHNADKWDKNYENLRDSFEKSGDEWQSNHVVPVTIAAVETAKSEISEQQIRPIISARGAEDECKSKVFPRIFDYGRAKGMIERAGAKTEVRGPSKLTAARSDRRGVIITPQGEIKALPPAQPVWAQQMDGQ